MNLRDHQQSEHMDASSEQRTALVIFTNVYMEHH